MIIVKKVKMGIRRKRRLTRKEFAKLFGFLPKMKARTTYLAKCHRIQRLFDLMADLKKKRSWQIFLEVYKTKEKASKRHSHFLRDVTTCPKKIVVFCQKELGFTAPEKSD